MKKAQNWLAGILLLQLLLAGGLWAHDRYQEQTLNQRTPLFKLESSRVDRLEIAHQDQVLKLEKDSESGWSLPDLHGLPASAHQVQMALQSIADLETGWPVASQASSHERFELSEESPRSRVKLYQGDELLAELLLGSSPSFRTTHLRAAGRDEVYRAELAHADFPADPARWLDKGLLQVNEIRTVRREQAYELELDGQKWKLEEFPENRELDQEKARALVRALEGLKVASVAESGPSTWDAEITVETPRRPFCYSFAKQGRDYLVRRDDKEPTFVISKAVYDSILEVDRSALLKEPQEKS